MCRMIFEMVGLMLFAFVSFIFRGFFFLLLSSFYLVSCHSHLIIALNFDFSTQEYTLTDCVSVVVVHNLSRSQYEEKSFTHSGDAPSLSHITSLRMGRNESTNERTIKRNVQHKTSLTHTRRHAHPHRRMKNFPNYSYVRCVYSHDIVMDVVEKHENWFGVLHNTQYTRTVAACVCCVRCAVFDRAHCKCKKTCVEQQRQTEPERASEHMGKIGMFNTTMAATKTTQCVWQG